MTSLRFLTFTFWNAYVLKLLRLETLTFNDVTLSDINIVGCHVLSQYLHFRYDKKSMLKVVDNEKGWGSEAGYF